MSAHNGDKARYHSLRKRRIAQRQKMRAMAKSTTITKPEEKAQAKTAGQ